jgi:hypothetical protein
MSKPTQARRRFTRQSGFAPSALRLGPFVVALVIVAAVTGGGCSLFNNVDSPSTTTTTPDTFAGTVGVHGSAITNFTVAQTGTVSVTLAAMSPSVAMGLGIGTPNGTTSCTLTSSNASALAGSTPQLSVSEPAGSYCISVYDVGNLTGTASFTVTVSHP